MNTRVFLQSVGGVFNVYKTLHLGPSFVYDYASFLFLGAYEDV